MQRVSERIQHEPEKVNLTDVVASVGLLPTSEVVHHAYVTSFLPSPEDVYRGVAPVAVVNDSGTASVQISVMRALLAMNPGLVAVKLSRGDGDRRELAEVGLGALRALAQPGGEGAPAITCVVGEGDGTSRHSVELEGWVRACARSTWFPHRWDEPSSACDFLWDFTNLLAGT